MTAGVYRRFILLCLALTGTSAPLRAATVPYVIDERYATIEFTTSGLFPTQGSFRNFYGHLALDFAAPANSSVDVTLDDRAIALSYPPGVQTLESPAYFNSQVYPTIFFRSTSIKPGAKPGEYDVLGALTIRGVTKPQMMVASLLSAPPASKDAGTADFYVTGTMLRSAFGMVADQDAVNDAIVLKIHARVTMAAAK